MPAELKVKNSRRLGIIKSRPPAGFVIPIVGLTAHEEDEIEAKSPEGGNLDVVRARVAEADLNAILERIQAAEIDGVSTTGILGDEGNATVSVDTRRGGDLEAVRARVTVIVQNYIEQTALPVGSSTGVADYVRVEAGWFLD